MKVNRIIPILFVLLTLGACSTDFELEAEWQDIPIVYGFISIQDTAHYVRVEKAFLEPGGNALEIAKIADSIYYGPDEITVMLENIETAESFTMERVDGTNEGYPKEDGLFATEPNILYKLPTEALDLQGGEPIRLTIVRDDGLEPVVAETQVSGPMDSIPNSFTKITRWLYTQDQTFGWQADPNNKLFDLRFLINYREFPNDNPSAIEEKQLIWIVNDAIVNEDDDDRLAYKVRGLQFYNYIGQNIPVNDGVTRIFDSFDVVITGTGPELFEFLRLKEANSGITSAQNIPTYTNVEGGLGLLSSRYQLTRTGIRLAEDARDSLSNGIYTKDLNFR